MYGFESYSTALTCHVKCIEPFGHSIRAAAHYPTSLHTLSLLLAMDAKLTDYGFKVVKEPTLPLLEPSSQSTSSGDSAAATAALQLTLPEVFALQEQERERAAMVREDERAKKTRWWANEEEFDWWRYYHRRCKKTCNSSMPPACR